MEITEAQYERIADCLPRQRGNVRLKNLDVLNSCTWRSKAANGVAFRNGLATGTRFTRE